MAEPDYQFYRDYLALPPDEQRKAEAASSLLRDFRALGGQGRAEVLDALRPAESTPVTAESVKAELGPANIFANPQIGTTAARVVPPIAGAIVGGIPGAAVGGAGGEWLAQQIEGRGTRWPTVALEGILNAIPFGKAASTTARTIAKRAAQGGVLGGVGGTGRVALEEDRLPTGEELLTWLGTGGALGGALGGVETFARRGGTTPPVEAPIEPPARSTGPRLALPPATNPPTVDAAPIPGLSEADILMAQLGMKKRNRAVEARVLKERAKADLAERQAREIIGQQKDRTVALPHPWEELPTKVETPEARLFRLLRGEDYPPPPAVKTPPGMNVLEAVDRWNPRGLAMADELAAAERLRQSPGGREGLLRTLADQDLPPGAGPAAEGPHGPPSPPQPTAHISTGSPLLDQVLSVERPAGDPIVERMQMIRAQVDDARTALPTGKQYGTVEGEHGTIEKRAIGAAKSIREQLSPLFPELRELPDVGPKQIVEAIEKDRGNKLYMTIKDAVTRQLERESVDEAALAARPTDFDEFSRFVDDLAAQERATGSPPTTSPRTSTGQPRLFESQATMPPSPLQPKAPQVEHGDLLAGFKKPELEPPTLPFEGTTELHAGLPIPKAIKDRIKSFFVKPTGVGMTASRTSERSGKPPVSDLAGDPPAAVASTWNNIPEIMGRTLGPEFKPMFAGPRGYQTAVDRNLSQATLTLRQAPVQHLNPAEQVNAMQALEGRAAPSSPKVAAVVKVIDGLRKQFDAFYRTNRAETYAPAIIDTTSGAQLKAATWKPYQGRANYWQQKLDLRPLVKEPLDTIAKEIMQAPRQVSLTPQEAVEVARAWRAKAKNQPLPQPLSPRIAELVQVLHEGGPSAAHLHQRTGMVIPDKYRVPLRDLLPDWIRDNAEEMAALEVFGPRDGKIEQAFAQARLRGEPQLKLAQEWWYRLRGRYPEPASAASRAQTLRILGQAATANFLGPLTMLRQLSQVGMAAAELSPKGFIVGLGKALTKQGALDAQFAGAAVDDIAREYTNLYSIRQQWTHAPTLKDKLEAITSWTADKTIRWNRINKMDEFGRRVMYLGAKYDFEHWQQAALMGDGKALGKLRKAGLTPSASPDDIARASKVAADTVNLRTGPMHNPVTFYEPGSMGQAMSTLNGFNIAMAKRLKDGYLGPLWSAIKAKDVAATAEALRKTVKLTASMTVTGEILGDTIRFVQGRADDRPGGTFFEFADDLIAGRVPAETLLLRWGDDLMFSGMMGYLGVAKEAVMSTGSIAEKSWRFASPLLGAGVSNVIETGNHLVNLASTVNPDTPQEEKERDRAVKGAVNAAARRLPFGVGQLTPGVMPQSKTAYERQAIARLVRALQRPGGHKDAADARAWYRSKTGESLSATKVQRALREARQ